MRFADIIKTSSANLWRNKGRTILTTIAVFIGAFTLYMTLAVNTGVNDYIDKQLSGLATSNALSITKQDAEKNKTPNTDVQEFEEGSENNQGSVIAVGPKFTKISKSDIEKIKSIKGITDSGFAILATADYIQGQNGKKFVININQESFDGQIKMDLKSGRQVDNKTSNEINIPLTLVNSLGFSNAEDALNKTVKIRTSNAYNGQKKIFEAKIVGVLNKNLIQSGLTLVSTNFAKSIEAFQLIDAPKTAQNDSYFVWATLNNEYKSEEKINQIKKELEDQNFKGTTAADEIKSFKDVVNAITGGLMVFGAIALIAASFGIINTLYMSVRERTREIGLMKAMGMPNSKIFTLFSVEAILIGLWGSIIGILVGLLVSLGLNNFASNTFLKNLDGFVLAQFDISNAIVIIVIVGIISFISGVLPSRKASRKDPIESLRYE